MGEFSRIVGVFFEPTKTFTDIAQRPGWIVPMLLLIVAVLCVSATIGRRIGWERIARQQAESSSRFQQQTPEQREQGLALAIKITSAAAYVGPIIFIAVFQIIAAAILLGIAGGLMGGGLRFKQVFAVVTYSRLVGVVSAILTIAVVFLKNPDEFNVNNPLAFNVGAFLDPTTTSKFVYAFATWMDLFTIWTIYLMATGLKVAAGKKLSFGGAFTAVAVPWFILVLISSGLAGLR